MHLVYMEAGPLVAHVVADELVDAEGGEALCGREPWPERWQGINTPAQRVSAAGRPLCFSCRGELARRGGKS
ncbi:hypothetical protein [Streptomyces sp. NPDC002855]|uniref:hypothetical protein n=1 Tax=Streptomyces sp. NPDC002855 TaxID=3154437 RepID=UPI003333B045